MSNSLLYHAFSIRGYRYVATRYREGEVFLKVEMPRESLCCPVCGHAHVHVVERFPRRWRTLPIGARCVWIEMEVPRVECQQCGARRRVAPTFADPKRRHTRSFERYVMELLQFMTPQDISWHLGISWDLAYDIEKRRLGETFCPAEAQEAQADRHRRDPSWQAAPLYHPGVGPGLRGRRLRGRRQGAGVAENPSGNG